MSKTTGLKRRKVVLPISDQKALDAMSYEQLRSWVTVQLWDRRNKLGSVNYLFSIKIDEDRQRVVVIYESQLP